MNRTPKLTIKSLEKAILDLHDCKSKWIESVPVKEVFKGETVWEGVVEVFGLLNHPQAKLAYTWSHEIEGSKKRKFYAVLHEGKVDSPEKAVRAVIVRDYKISKKE